MSAVVAIVGKPNVGKSTLFNRIVRKRLAIESKVSGTTRDRISAQYTGKNLNITFVDTGGITFDKTLDNIEQEVQKQSNMALNEADLILFCVDTKTLPTQLDYEIAQNLRKKSKEKRLPIFFVGTKCDRVLDDSEKANYYDFGFDENETFFISAFHNFAVDNLLNAVEEKLTSLGFTQTEKCDDDKISIAILGKPNSGKSSLVNAFLNENKLIVSDIPGTTRDSVNFEVKFHEKMFELIDTAGIRRRSNRERGIEEYSVMRSLKALENADVAVLLIDSTEGASHQDQIIMSQIIEAKTGLIIAVNKWDEQKNGRFALSEDEKEEARDKFINHLRSKFPFVPWAPVVFVSALEKRNLTKIFELSEKIKEERKKEIPTPLMNQFLQELFMKHPLRGKGNITPKVKFGRQKDINPPHFLFFINDPDCVHFSSRRFLENKLRSTFGFEGTSIVLEFRQK